MENEEQLKKERRKEISKKFYQTHYDELRKKRQEYYEKNKEKIAQKNKEKCKYARRGRPQKYFPPEPITSE